MVQKSPETDGRVCPRAPKSCSKTPAGSTIVIGGKFGCTGTPGIVEGEKTALPLNPRSKIRIALADDPPIFRDGLRRLLALEPDLEVVCEANDGSEVVEMIRRHKPDVLLLDLKMPMADGFSILQDIRREECKTRVLVLTASDDAADHVRAIKFGAMGVVLKQTATEVLVKSIHKVHEGGMSLGIGGTVGLAQSGGSSAETLPGSRGKPRLSPREREVVALVAEGLRNKQIADRLSISQQTVKNHISNIFMKLQVSDRLELALRAIQGKLGSD